MTLSPRERLRVIHGYEPGAEVEAFELARLLLVATPEERRYTMDATATMLELQPDATVSQLLADVESRAMLLADRPDLSILELDHFLQLAQNPADTQAWMLVMEARFPMWTGVLLSSLVAKPYGRVSTLRIEALGTPLAPTIPLKPTLAGEFLGRQLYKVPFGLLPARAIRGNVRVNGWEVSDECAAHTRKAILVMSTNLDKFDFPGDAPPDAGENVKALRDEIYQEINKRGSHATGTSPASPGSTKESRDADTVRDQSPGTDSGAEGKPATAQSRGARRTIRQDESLLGRAAIAWQWAMILFACLVLWAVVAAIVRTIA